MKGIGPLLWGCSGIAEEQRDLHLEALRINRV